MAIIDVVKYNGGDRVYAWKFPNESLSTWTQLIVNESQEAVLVKDGVALDVFPSGRYTLDTENIPMLRRVIKLPFGNRSPFSAEVWFINKAYTLDIKWGTATPVQIQDPRYGIFIPLRSFGQFGVKINEAKKFLVKLAGPVPVFDKEHLVQYFRGVYLTKVKDALSTYLIHKKISILEINAYLEEISSHLQERIKPAFDEYGIELVNFFINDISVPEDDPAVRKLKNALAKRAEMEIIGYDYQQERSFDTIEGAAKSPGGFMSAGLGVGMGAQLSQTLGEQMGKVKREPAPKLCPACQQPILPEGAKFCSECGAALGQTCRFCQKAIVPGAKFCSHCGRSLEEA
jgi:membrane protease subunit (stomatin/prohibitin family)